MERDYIFLLVGVFVFLGKFSRTVGEKYELNEVRRVVESEYRSTSYLVHVYVEGPHVYQRKPTIFIVALVFFSLLAVFGDGKIKYLEDHPTADTDKIPEAKRVEMCRKAFQHFRKEHPESIKNFYEDGMPGKMKPYLVAHSLFGDLKLHFSVLPAYECATRPRLYIHLDVRDGRGEPNRFEVLYTKPRPEPVFDKFRMFQMLIVKDVLEANVEKVESMRGTDISTSLYDFDQLEEDQRFRLCERAASILPLPKERIKVFKNRPTERSHLKLMILKNENTSSNESLMQVFGCWSEPKIYVYVNGSQSKQHLWTIVKESEIDQPPRLDIVEYEIQPVASIEVFESSQVKREKELKRKQVEESRKFAMFIKDSGSMDMRKRLQEVDGLDFNAIIKRRKVIKEAAIDTDKETAEGRREICAKAIKVISGRETDFASDISNESTASHYYTVDPKNWMEPNVVNAYPCPTTPQVLVHIGKRLTDQNHMVTLIALEDDVETLTSRF